VREYRKALFSLASAGLIRLRECPEDILKLGKPGEDSGEVYLKFHSTTGHWKAMPSGLRGKGIYSAAKELGLTLGEVATAFSAS